MAFQGREYARKLKHSGSAGSVVIGSRMDLPDLRRGQRIIVAAPQMIVVSSDDDIFVCLSRQIREHVIDGRARGFDVHVDGHA